MTPGTIVATPHGLGRVLGPSVRQDTETGPMWTFPYRDPVLGKTLLVSPDGPFVAVLAGGRVEAVFADDVQAVNPRTLGSLERIWVSVFGVGDKAI